MIPTLEKECKEFLARSNGRPLLKNLPIHNDGFRKVKVRKKKNQNSFIKSFNQAFFHEHEDLMLRSVFANGESSFTPAVDGENEAFYVFPIDGFQFMYSPEVKCSTLQYKEMFDRLLETIGYEGGVRMFTEVLKYDYNFSDFENGITIGAELIIYDIPYYYAIRKSLIEDYQQFLYN